MPQNPDLTAPVLRHQLEEVVATALDTFLTNFTRDLFPDYKTTDAQDCISAGIAIGLDRYQRTSGTRITDTIIASLHDIK